MKQLLVQKHPMYLNVSCAIVAKIIIFMRRRHFMKHPYHPVFQVPANPPPPPCSGNSESHHDQDNTGVILFVDKNFANASNWSDHSEIGKLLLSITTKGGSRKYLFFIDDSCPKVWIKKEVEAAAKQVLGQDRSRNLDPRRLDDKS